MRRAAVALGAAIAALASLAPAASAAFPGANGRIAYEVPGQGLWDVNPDGSAPRRLTNVACDAHPAYSLAGQTIAFDSCAGGGIALFTIAADGSQRQELPAPGSGPPFVERPSFGPSGTALAFDAGRFSTGVLSQNLDGTGLARIASVGYDPAWSVLGQVAFVVPRRNAEWCNSTTLQDVWVANQDGTRRRRVTRNNGSYAPDWSPDGRRIAFTRDTTVSSRDVKRLHGIPDCKRLARAAGRYGPQVFVATASGHGVHRLTRAGGDAPAWSPDGKLIAFERRPWIYVMNADGSGLHRLVQGRDPAWQPVSPPGAPASPRR